MQTMAARHAYELWAETYPPVAHNPLMRAEQAVVARRLAAIRSTCALDVGTGSGRYTPLLEATGAATVVGADLSMAMLSRNATRHRVCADAHRLPLSSATFDLINASLIAGDIPDLTPWMAELGRVLMPGGHLIYSDFHPNWDDRGWQRTFRARDGAERALPRASHQLTDHFAAIEGAGLDVIAANEVKVPMGRSGPMRLWRPALVAVAMVFHARKAAR
jgi:ubiquinone/menaquinone biosynthesis C-methylase UbiE